MQLYILEFWRDTHHELIDLGIYSSEELREEAIARYRNLKYEAWEDQKTLGEMESEGDDHRNSGFQKRQIELNVDHYAEICNSLREWRKHTEVLA